MTNTHFIQKQNIELVFGSEEAAENQWEGFLNLHKQEGLGVMSALFDRIAPEKTWIRIDRLEIDLGIVAETSLRASYAELLQTTLEKALSRAITMQENILQADAASVWESNIIHYLEHGFFLWESVVPGFSKTSAAIQQPARDIIEKKILELLSGNPGFSRSLHYKLVQNPVVVQRWLRQFSADFHSRAKELLLRNATGSLQTFIVSAAGLVEKVLAYGSLQATGYAYEKTQSIIWKIFFSDTVQHAGKYLEEWIKDRPVNQQLKQSVVTLLANGNETGRKKLLDHLVENPVLLSNKADKEVALTIKFDKLLTSLFAQAGIVKDKKPGIENNQRKPNNADTNKSNKIFEEKATGQNKIKDHDSDSPESAGDHTAGDNKKKMMLRDKIMISPAEEVLASPGNEIYIDNAGIVLLSPFIEHFFNSTGLDTTRMLEDDRDASLGVQLLQLLAGGAWDEAEHKLSLNKILCGRTPGWPAYHITGMPVNATTECTDLLQSVIRYWDVLKGTSPEGLQETFLQREGKLVFKEEGWRLWVEYKTPDILLQQMPWSFSVVKFPWMQYPLYIEW